MSGVWGCCPEGVGRLSKVVVEAVWRLCGGYLMGVRRLSGGCEEAV